MMNSTSSSNFSMNAILLENQETDSDTEPYNECMPIYILVCSFFLTAFAVILYLWVI